MGPLTFSSSQNEESDFAAEGRWENEGGNPGQLQQLPCDDRKEEATTGPARGALKAFCYRGQRHMHLIQFREIMRDAEVAYAIHPIVRK